MNADPARRMGKKTGFLGKKAANHRPSDSSVTFELGSVMCLPSLAPSTLRSGHTPTANPGASVVCKANDGFTAHLISSKSLLPQLIHHALDEID